ncbi:Ribosomal large subunit pseudouridine synthase C [Raoultella terrigena]|uniref:Ribosomal large subunit pseudouridine synthase C n=1 Tax=Raoultella terrigena TaxID=577 RepID=A0A3P8KG77_RAOTE|nr:Ribosomal large subunit pseudouridine synthase C [Raoultella terrigena]
MSGANASGYLESRTMKTETPTVKMVAITADEAGQRIDNFLRTQLKGVPKSMIYRILRKGEVRVNKKRVKPEYKLEAGDEIRIPPVRVAEREEDAVSRICKKSRLWRTSFCMKTIISWCSTSPPVPRFTAAAA